MMFILRRCLYDTGGDGGGGGVVFVVSLFSISRATSFSFRHVAISLYCMLLLLYTLI